MSALDDEHDYDLEFDDLDSGDWEMMRVEPPEADWSTYISKDEYYMGPDPGEDEDFSSNIISRDIGFNIAYFTNKVKLLELLDDEYTSIIESSRNFSGINGLNEYKTFIEECLKDNFLKHFINHKSALTFAKKSAKENRIIFYIYHYSSKELTDPILDIQDGIYVSSIRIKEGLMYSYGLCADDVF